MRDISAVFLIPVKRVHKPHIDLHYENLPCLDMNSADFSVQRRLHMG